MKKNKVMSVIATMFLAYTTFGQDIPQSQVPSLIVNNFQQAFPKASDIEWELERDLYKVEFEIGLLGNDVEVWYDKTGNMLKKKEEISKGDLPQKVLTKLNQDFGSYRTSDVKKITEGAKVMYKMELKSFTEEWEVVFDSEGNVLSKVAD